MRNDFESNYLMHHGILGQKWGVRRFQNPDGSLTTAGKIRYGKGITVSKDQTIFRSTRSDSEAFLNRKYTYVNATDSFRNHSLATSEGFDGQFNTVFEMKPSKNLKIANFNDFVEEVINTAGKDINIDEIENDTVERGISIIEKLPHDYKDGMFGNSEAFDKIVDSLKKKGFDGVIDPIDARNQYKNLGDDEHEEVMSMLIFNPKENLKVKSKFSL